jgi:hypothetical protein
VLQNRLPHHNQSVKNTIDIIPKRGIIKGSNKNTKINKMFHKVCTKIPDVINDFKVNYTEST